MSKPNFLIIGAMKAGTTWLARRLGQHPQVFMTSSLYFFDNEKNFAKGMEWYERCFAKATAERAIGEKTPSYLWGERFDGENNPERVPERVHRLLPDAKMLVILRNPASRAVSHFNYAIQTGKLPPQTSIDRVLTQLDCRKVARGILERGLYARQLERWLEHFPRRQVCVLFLERDVVQQPRETLTDLCRFLEVDASFEFTGIHEKQNATLSTPELVLRSYSRPLQKLLHPILKYFPHKTYTASPATHAYLTEYYAEANARLARLLNVDLTWWKKAKAA